MNTPKNQETGSATIRIINRRHSLLLSLPFLAPKFIDIFLRQVSWLRLILISIPSRLPSGFTMDFVTNTVGGTAADLHRFPFSSTSCYLRKILNFTVGNYSTAHLFVPTHVKGPHKAKEDKVNAPCLPLVL